MDGDRTLDRGSRRRRDAAGARRAHCGRPRRPARGPSSPGPRDDDPRRVHRNVRRGRRVGRLGRLRLPPRQPSLVRSAGTRPRLPRRPRPGRRHAHARRLARRVGDRCGDRLGTGRRHHPAGHGRLGGCRLYGARADPDRDAEPGVCGGLRRRRPAGAVRHRPRHLELGRGRPRARHSTGQSAERRGERVRPLRGGGDRDPRDASYRAARRAPAARPLDVSASPYAARGSSAGRSRSARKLGDSRSWRLVPVPRRPSSANTRRASSVHEASPARHWAASQSRSSS